MTTQTSTAALVTGGTSGIGLAVVRDLARRGHRVFLCARTEQQAKETVTDLLDEGLEAAGAPSPTSATPTRSRPSSRPPSKPSARSASSSTTPAAAAAAPPPTSPTNCGTTSSPPTSSASSG